VRDALSLLLGIHDYRVAVFGDAESFLKAYKKEWRGCVLLDIRMPGMDGLALQKHLAGLGSELPVIVMTGHGDVASCPQRSDDVRKPNGGFPILNLPVEF
jgi:FixJ family two-component response regulator